MEARSVFGCSSKETTRLKEGCCFVLRLLMSLTVSEKKATSLPAIKKERRYSTAAIKLSRMVAAGVNTDSRLKVIKPVAE
jgi:hypothetical protein